MERRPTLVLDLGANYEGYIGDLCRTAVLGDPDVELQDLLDEVITVQDAAMAHIRAGALGGAVQDADIETLQRSPHRDNMHFVAHGVALVSHEVPHLTDASPAPYRADDAGRALKSGMVLSVETSLLHPRRGFIQLEDTVAVLDDGFEFFGGARDAGGQFIGESIGEVILRRIARKIGEGQHHDGKMRGGGRRAVAVEEIPGAAANMMSARIPAPSRASREGLFRRLA